MKLVHFGMPLNHTVVDDVAKSVVMKMSADVIIMLAVLADGGSLS